MSVGCLGVTAAYVILTAAAWVSGPGAKASPLWLLAYFVVLTIGELYLSPIGLSLFSTLAPPWAVSAMMGLWLATSFPGNLIAGWLGGFWNAMAKPHFFLMMAAIAGAASAAIRVCGRPLARVLEERHQAPEGL
jgi:POT family proton-dependent oligopeptide transporter